MKFFKNTRKALFLSRPNRFTILCNLNGRAVKAFLPNPGRLWELLLPGASVYLEDASVIGRTLPYTAVAVEKDSSFVVSTTEKEGHPVMVHTHRTNDVARFLIEKGLVPGLEGAEVLQQEVTKGRSRFDFLLKRGETKIILEVKSCTLFSKRIAMFPDAVTSRGRRHIEELALLSDGKTEGVVLFLIHWPYVEVFMPEYHTDLEFAKALFTARERINIIPISLRWEEDLSLTPEVRVLSVPWRIVEREAKDRGSYLLLLKLPKETIIEIGKPGRIRFRSGYYTYVGSARRNLTKRIERHRRLRKMLFWHIDYLRQMAEFHVALPIQSEDDLECEVAQAVKGITEWEVTGFGASDCSCNSHLFWTKTDPMKSLQFHDLLQYYRMDRLMELQ